MRILGWRVAATIATSIVLDSIDHAIWTRQQDGVSDLNDVVHHTDRGSQHMSTRFTERLADAGIHRSVGATGHREGVHALMCKGWVRRTHCRGNRPNVRR